MSRTYTEWICANCGRRTVQEWLVYPEGWFEIAASEGPDVEVCSLECLNEVAHNWAKTHAAIEKEKGGDCAEVGV